MSKQVNFNFDVEALYEFIPEQPDELQLIPGEIYRVLEDLDENWWLLRNTQGQCGIAPRAYVERAPTYTEPQESLEPLFLAAALYDFKPLEDWHLSIRTNEIYAVLETDESGWWRVQQHSEFPSLPQSATSSDIAGAVDGLVPGAYLQPLQRIAEGKEKEDSHKGAQERVEFELKATTAPTSDQQTLSFHTRSRSSSFRRSKDPPPFKARALYDYLPQDLDEMILVAGELYTIIRTTRSGWWIGLTKDAEKKMIPRNFVEPLHVAHAFQSFNSSASAGRCSTCSNLESVHPHRKNKRPKQRPRNPPNLANYQRSAASSLSNIHSRADVQNYITRESPIGETHTTCEMSAVSTIGKRTQTGSSSDSSCSEKHRPLPTTPSATITTTVTVNTYHSTSSPSAYKEVEPLPSSTKSSLVGSPPSTINKPLQLQKYLRSSWSKDNSYQLSHTYHHFFGEDSSLCVESPVRGQRLTLFEATSMYDYEPEAPGELALKAGNTYTILEVTNAGWWLARGPHGEGMVPRRCMSRSHSSTGGGISIGETPSILKQHYICNSFEPRKSKLPLVANRHRRILTSVQSNHFYEDLGKYSHELEVKNVSVGNIAETHQIYQWKLDLRIDREFDFDSVRSITVRVLDKISRYAGPSPSHSLFVPSTNQIDISHLEKGQSKIFDASTICVVDGVHQVVIRDTNTWKVVCRTWMLVFVLDSDKCGLAKTSPTKLSSPVNYRETIDHSSEHKSRCCHLM